MTHNSPRQIIIEKKFKRDAKKHYLDLLTPAWSEVLAHLIHKNELPKKYRDHALSGNWQGFRDCHIKPDLVLIYAIDEEVIQLVRLGTHAELFG
jgi:mRNA interferase YafQ